MNKKLLALKILLPILIVLIVAMLTLQIKSFELRDDNENGLIFAFALIANVIPMIAMGILGIAAVAIIILLFAGKKTSQAVIGALVILCLLAPFVGFSVFVNITALYFWVEVPIIAVATLGVNIAALVLCCILIHENRRNKKTVTVDN
ncbi:MAG: hypothetical protein J1F66_04595 [Clostridiales bacterium]|nr:hypothetical protein [Clostridiales bacterium]